ncbi:MAG: four-carbon acid sugar kinase family protein [Acidimicrobiia bacterium]
MIAVLAAVLADDLTGALEVGALAAAGGLPVRVHLDVAGPFAAGDVSVVDTETRIRSDDGAFRFAAALDSCLPAVPWIYKKVDSTLRGPIFAELDALGRALPHLPIVYVPAYPALGRTVVGGELRVHGVPVARTAFANDVHQPIRSSSVVGLFELFEGVAPARSVRSCTPATIAAALADAVRDGRRGLVFVCDAETEHDLDEIAAALRAASAPALVAGSGGFASRWLAAVPGERRVPRPLPSVRSALLVCGSRHPASLAQADAAAAFGVPCLRPTIDERAGPAAVAEDLGRRAADAIGEHRPDLVVVFGGDTAFAVLRGLGCDTLEPLGEVLPGVPVSRFGELVVVTKAGGFGEVDVVAKVTERLS